MQKILCILAATMLFLSAPRAQTESELKLEVDPAIKWLTEAQPYGDLRLTNHGTVELEITIAPTGLEMIPGLPLPTIGDLSPHLTVFPPRMILSPGETQILRYAVMDLSPLSDGGHVARIIARIARRTPLSQLQTPAAAASLLINFEMVTHQVLLKGVGEPEMSAEVLSLEAEKIVMGLTNHGNSPWAGRIHLLSEDGQQSFGTADATLFLHREVEITLDADLPKSFRLEFETDNIWIPPHSIRTPEPILVTR